MVCSYGGVRRRMHGQSHLQIICIYIWSSYSGHVSNSLGKTLTFFKKMSMEKCRFWVLTCTVLVHNWGFHNKFLLNSICTFLFNFLFSRSKFSYTLWVSWVIKQTCEICDTISNKIRKIKKLFISKKFYIRGNNIVDWIETSDQEHYLYITLLQ